MNAIIFDTETTGLDAPELVESAWICVDVDGTWLADLPAQVSRWRPSKPISLGAMATHHIMDEDLLDMQAASEFRLPDGIEYLIGYNVDFDWKAIGQPSVRRIDLCAMCRALWPDADSHTQSAMLYLLERETARKNLQTAHGAWTDVANCHRIMLHVLAKAGPFDSFESFWRASELMRVPKVLAFGKHKGTRIAEVPRDYCAWLLKQPDVDPYLASALRGRLQA